MQHHLYTRLIAPLVQSLAIEVMVLGLFLVSFGYVRAAFKTPDTLKTADFAKRILLLGSVMLFMLYVVSSYQIDASTLPEKMVDNDMSALTKIRVLCLAPLELILIGIEATMFLILGIDAASSLTDSNELPSITQKLRRIFIASAAWHGAVILWWLLWIGTDYFSLSSLVQQIIFLGLYICAAIFWTRLQKSTRCSRYEWAGVLTYTCLVLLVYSTRMWWYIDQAAQDSKKSSPPEPQAAGFSQFDVVCRSPVNGDIYAVKATREEIPSASIS